MSAQHIQQPCSLVSLEKIKGIQVPDLDDLGCCIELINSAATPEEAFVYFGQILAGYGYDRITYSLVTDHPSLGLPKQHGLATSYPEGWMDYYRARDYMQLDPVVREVLSTRKPFFWNDVIARSDLPKESLLVMNEASEAGLKDGVGFSLSNTAGEVVGIGLARSEAVHDQKNYDFLAKAYLLATFFHESYRDMLLRCSPEMPLITVREHDVLLWAAEGKTDQEIGIILGISFHTVRFHWRKIFRKLDVNGKSFAITKAIRTGLITPEVVRTTTNFGSNGLGKS